MRRSSLLTGATVMAAVSLTGCSLGAGGVGGTDGTYSIALSDDVDTLDPHLYTSPSTNVLLPFVYDRLLGVDDDGEVVSGLASEWDITTTSATFTIRDDVTCSNGDAFGVEDVVANFERILNPDTNAPLTSGYLGAAEFTVTSDAAANTVTLDFTKPNPYLDYGFSRFPFMVCQAGLEDVDALGATPVGTGPFVLESSAAGQTYELSARDDYAWGPDGATTSDDALPQNVRVSIVGDSGTIANQLRSGEVNLAQLEPAEAAQFESDDAYSSMPGATTSLLLAMNQAPERDLADVALRQAIAGAIDRSQFASILVGAESEAPEAVLTTTLCLTSQDGLFPETDPDASIEALEAAGYTFADGTLSREGTPVTLSIVQWDASTAAVEYLQSQLDAIGIATEVNGLSGEQATPFLYTPASEWDLAVGAYAAATPANLYPVLGGTPAPPDGANFSAISNESFLALGVEAQQASGDENCGLWADAYASLVEEMNILPVAASTPQWVMAGGSAVYARPFIIPTSLELE